MSKIEEKLKMACLAALLCPFGFSFFSELAFRFTFFQNHRKWISGSANHHLPCSIFILPLVYWRFEKKRTSNMNFRIKKRIIHISTSVLLAAVLFIILLFVFSLVAHEIVLENEDWFDTHAFDFLKSRSTPAVIAVFKFITFFGSPRFFLPAYVILILLLLYRHRREDALHVALLGIISTLLMFGLKRVFARGRPELPLFRELTNYSFPSGHALSSFVFCSAIIWLVWKSQIAKAWKIAIACFLLFFSLCIGISRIVLRYHYASDVLAGFCLGFGWVLLYFLLQKWINRRRNKNIFPVNEE
jgi:undecaprenyl-diphosphatase